MINLVFSPRWFYGYDIIFEILAVIVTFLIGVASYKLYRFTKDYRHKYFAWSFWALTVSFLAKIATNFVIYYHKSVRDTVGETLVRYNLIEKSNIFFEAGWDVHRFMMFMGLLGIYWLVSKSRDSNHKWIFMFLLFIITIISFNLYIIFHITAALLLTYIVGEYYKICSKKSKNNLSARLNLIAFITILLSQIVFIFVFIDTHLYVVAEILQLLGYLLFFINLLKLVLFNDKKKNSH